MPTDPTSPKPSVPQPDHRPPTPEAERALAEANARRAERDRHKAQQNKEVGGRDGPEPTRYGDWEKDGIASDF